MVPLSLFKQTWTYSFYYQEYCYYREPEENQEGKLQEKLEEKSEERAEDKQIEEGKIKKNQRRRKRRPAAHRFELQGISSGRASKDFFLWISKFTSMLMTDLEHEMCW